MFSSIEGCCTNWGRCSAACDRDEVVSDRWQFYMWIKKGVGSPASCSGSSRSSLVLCLGFLLQGRKSAVSDSTLFALSQLHSLLTQLFAPCSPSIVSCLHSQTAVAHWAVFTLCSSFVAFCSPWGEGSTGDGIVALWRGSRHAAFCFLISPHLRRAPGFAPSHWRWHRWRRACVSRIPAC